MNRSEFNFQMERLQKVYGATKYPIERQDAIYNHVGKINYKQFEEQVTEFIASMDKAPLLTDFRQVFASILSDLRKLEIEALEKVWAACSSCSGTGHVTMYNKKSGWEFAYQCTCPRGEILQPTFPKQFAGMGDEYASHKAWSYGRFERSKVIRENGLRHAV